MKSQMLRDVEVFCKCGDPDIHLKGDKEHPGVPNGWIYEFTEVYGSGGIVRGTP